MLRFFFGYKPTPHARHLYDQLMQLVRQPALYLEANVPDTFEGRFNLLTLFASIMLPYLQKAEPHGPTQAQDLTDCLFHFLDSAVRERGVGDLSVPKKMRGLAGNFLGRAQVFQQALTDEDHGALAKALARNIHADEAGSDLSVLAQYARKLDAHFAAMATQAWAQGDMNAPAFIAQAAA